MNRFSFLWRLNFAVAANSYAYSYGSQTFRLAVIVTSWENNTPSWIFRRGYFSIIAIFSSGSLAYSLNASTCIKRGTLSGYNASTHIKRGTLSRYYRTIF